MSLEEYGYIVTTKENDETWDQNEYKFLYKDSAGGTFAKENSQATISYLCDYSYIVQFLDVVLGKTVQTGGTLRRSYHGAFDELSGSQPELHPIFENYYAATAEVEPIGIRPDDQDGPFWSKAKVTVVFRPPTYTIAPDGAVSAEFDRFTTKLTEGSAEFQTVQGFYRFVSDPNHRLLELSPGMIIPSSRITYTWHQIPAVDQSNGYPDLGKVPNLSTIMGLQGYVNSVAFDGLPPGTVLLTSWSARLILPQTASSGNYNWDISYILGYRDYGASAVPVVAGEHIGWNYAYDPVYLKGWDLYTTTGATTGATQYPYGDLTALFNPSW